MNLRREEAFTLIEVIVAITVFTIVLLALSNILINGWRFWDFNQQSVNLSQATTLISANLDRNIRSARIFEIDTDDGGLILYTGPGNNDNSEEYFFKYIIDENDENSRLILQKPSNNIDYNDLTSIVWDDFRYITDQIVLKNESFFERDATDSSIIVYSIKLENERKSITVKNKIRSRLQ